LLCKNSCEWLPFEKEKTQILDESSYWQRVLFDIEFSASATLDLMSGQTDSAIDYLEYLQQVGGLKGVMITPFNLLPRSLRGLILEGISEMI
jgi:peptidase E